MFVKGNFEDGQALGNLVDAGLLLTTARFGDDGRALGFFRAAPTAAAHPDPGAPL